MNNKKDLSTSQDVLDVRGDEGFVNDVNDDVVDDCR
jgi:hypothetical protein